MSQSSGTWSHSAVRTLTVTGCAAALCLLSPAAALAADHGGGRSAQGKAHAHQHAGRGHAARAGGSHGSSVALHDKRWQAQADPDGMENGGVDQPGGQGGTIGQQDGNNGSGNDADCEDDNRGRGIPGHCKPRPGKTPERATVSPPGVTNPEKGTSSVTAPSSTHPGRWSAVEAPTASNLGTAQAAAAPSAGTLPDTAQAAAAPRAGTLPDTGAGAGLVWYALGGAAAVGAGVAARRHATR